MALKSQQTRDSVSTDIGSMMAESKRQFDRLKEANADPSKLVIIHLCCQRHDSITHSPGAVSHVVVRDPGGSPLVFGRQGEDIRAELDRFAAFANANQDATWLHFDMAKIPYGFEGIESYHRWIGGTPAVIPPERRLDLKQVIRAIYGDDYTGRDASAHPRFRRLIEINEVPSQGLLNEDEAAAAYKNGHIQQLIASTVRKVDALWDLNRRVLQGKLEVAVGPAWPMPWEGPVSPDGFVANGVTVSGLTLKELNLLKEVWRSPYGVDEAYLIDTVWRENEEHIRENSDLTGAIRSAIYRVNRKLLKTGVSLHQRERRVTLDGKRV